MSKVFANENTMEIKDEKILKLFDRVKYEIGQCYSNSENLLKLLLKHDIDAKLFCGWVFTGDVTPVHHCWVVYQNSILDLSNDMTSFARFMIENGYNENDVDINIMRERLVEFRRNSMNWKNSKRCVVGTADNKIYVGSPCKSALEAANMYNDLIKNFPNHEVKRSINMEQMSVVQEMMLEAGLM